MSVLEQRLREELRDVTERVQLGQIRPLRALERRRLRWRLGWWAPAVALACVVAVALALVSRQGPAVTPTSGGMPRYYAVVSGSPGSEVVATVRKSVTGDARPVWTVKLPVRVMTGRVDTDWQVAAAADDRHFAIAVYSAGDLRGVISDVRLFLLTLTADGRPGHWSQAPVASNGDEISGIALSPDGSRLALSFKHEPFLSPGQNPTGSVRVLDLATGTSRTWSAAAASGYWPGEPSWRDARTVDLPWWHMNLTVAAFEVTGVRHLDVLAAGASLRAAPLTTFRAPVRAATVAVAGGGQVMIAMSCDIISSRAIAYRVVQLSAANGHLVRTLLTLTSPLALPSSTPVPSPSGGVSSGGVSVTLTTVKCPAPSVDASGRHILVTGITFGRIDNGAFTPLGFLAPDAAQPAVAW